MSKKSNEGKAPDRPPHILDPVHDFVEGQNDDRATAKRALREFFQKEAVTQSKSQQAAGKLLVATLQKVVKPLLHGNLEGQSLTDRLTRAVQNGEMSDNPQGLMQEIGTLGQFAGTIPAETAEPAKTATPSPILATQLLDALSVLSQGEEWIQNEIDTLRQRLPPEQDPAFWLDLGALSQRISQEAQSAAQWLKERQMFLNLVTELANRLHDMTVATGGFDHHLSASIQRIAASRTLQDLDTLRSALIQEAERLKQHTSTLQHKLEDNQRQLDDTQRRLQVMERELDLARTESRTDPLTGVANRRAFDDHLRREIAVSTRHNHPLSLIMFDLDHFKKVNDTYGHPIGDKVLVAVSERCGILLRQSDLLARLGGEEFAIILPDTTGQGARDVAEKIRHEIMKLRFKTSSGPFAITCSFGVVELTPAMDDPTLVHLADQALYQAKQSGRNRVVLAPAPD